jgi:molybdopterin/thiamine biosynthesis adenylyltransferase
MTTRDPQQQQMIREAMKAIAERKPGRTRLVYDKTKRTIVAVAEGTQAPRALNITADDADMFAVVTLSSQWMRDHWTDIQHGALAVTLSKWDGGDALTQSDLGVQPSCDREIGTVVLEGHAKVPPDGSIKIVLAPETSRTDSTTFVAPDGSRYRGSCWREAHGGRDPIDVSFVDVQPDFATRRSGILETNILRDKTVLLVGLGTGGAHVAIELAKCGVGHFILIDRDRLSVGNVVRHPGGISHVGRYKVNVMRDLILEKNPEADVSIHPVAVNYDNEDAIRAVVASTDIVICGTDNRPSKLLVNKLCVEADVTAVYGGAFRRAYGGQVLRVRPKQSPCHQCFISAMPDEATDVEVSTDSDAEAIAYSDRPVAVEPGLSLDVLPVANLVAKLALLELLAAEESSLNILQKDFDAPWYLWLNRPEPGTQYASWPALSESSDEMTIHRWYGVYLERDAACSVCGEFLAALASHYGVDLASVGDLPAPPGKES